ncbi:unnamed protein product [marine sediment metagenome]|uniref:Uncharacterized protein n=1 Tax=marine sediment metagenome TaxID=412755 RepID=X0US33_9ZZZZ
MSVVKNSAMRFSLTIISIAIAMTLLGIVAYIIITASKGGEPDWAGLGLFVGGLAVLLTGSGWNKQKQKEIEINEKQ